MRINFFRNPESVEQLTTRLSSLQGEEFNREFSRVIEDGVSLCGTCPSKIQEEVNKVRTLAESHKKSSNASLALAAAGTLATALVASTFAIFGIIGIAGAYECHKLAQDEGKLALTMENLGKLGIIK